MKPYICKKCGKEMWSFNDVVEYWDNIYCKHCAESPVTEQRPVKKNPIPMKSDVAAVNYREDSIREDKEAVHIKGQRNEAAIYKKGDFIGQKYEVFGVLGEGGFGIVYLVYSHETKSAYALKTFRDEYLADVTTRERFKNEAQVWIDLERHPYLVRASYVEEISGRLFIAMEHIATDDEGLNTLEGYLRSRPPDLAQSLRWAIQFCHGMEYAYSKGIKAHRDIKPANILIGQDKAVKISDFGLAGVISTSKPLSGIKINPQRNISGAIYQTMEGSAFGTPPYMPPEQFENAAGCNERSDIYSFGIVLYQMASGGKLPFLPEMAGDMDDNLFQNWYMLYSKATVPRLKSPLFPIIFRCLEKNPSNRYFSFKELRRDLESLLKKQTGEVVKVPELKELEAWELSNKGVSLANLGKYQEAIACYDRAIELNPRFAETWFNKGIDLESLGKHQEAIVCYDNALQINPGYAEAWYGKGASLSNLGKYQDAIACYDNALQIDPKCASAWFNKGVTLGRLGNHQEAIVCYDKTLQLYPIYASAWRNKGVTLGILGKHQEAIICFDRALELNPRYVEAWSNKGIALGMLGKHQEAIACFDTAIEINPGYAGAWSNKRVALENLGKNQEAIACYDNALEINPRDADAWYNKGVVLEGLGRPQEAIACYSKALEINPRHTAAWLNKGVSLGRLGKSAEAIVCFDRVLEINPRYADAWTNKGNALRGLGKYQEAIACHDNAIQINLRYDAAWLNKGVALDSLGKYQEAIACYDRVLEINPGFAKAWNNKGIALGKLGKHQDEIACYDNALEINPRYAEAWIEKGNSLCYVGNIMEAIVCYERALEIDPMNLVANKALPVLKDQKEYLQLMSKNGTAQDVIPWGTGEFGLEVTNPIPVYGFFGSMAYLRRLRTLDGGKVEYVKGSPCLAPNIEGPIDEYKILQNGKELIALFISPYHKKISNKAPKGFKMVFP